MINGTTRRSKRYTRAKNTNGTSHEKEARWYERAGRGDDRWFVRPSGSGSSELDERPAHGPNTNFFALNGRKNAMVEATINALCTLPPHVPIPTVANLSHCNGAKSVRAEISREW